MRVDSILQYKKLVLNTTKVVCKQLPLYKATPIVITGSNVHTFKKGRH
jgi:hypothetical protein